MSQRLPPLPNLGYLKKHAKDVLRVARHRYPQCRLTDAQHALARGYGFRSWPDLKVHIESLREPQSVDRTPGRRIPAERVTSRFRAAKAGHPMAGMWTTVHPLPFLNDAAQHPADLVVEFDVIGDTVSLIQIASDETGEQTAVKMAIRADGREHPFHFGHELVMQARWSDLRTLEMIVKHGDAIVSSGTVRGFPGREIANPLDDRPRRRPRASVVVMPRAALAVAFMSITSACSFSSDTGGRMQTQFQTRGRPSRD